jgi:hypothetical protein
MPGTYCDYTSKTWLHECLWYNISCTTCYSLSNPVALTPRQPGCSNGSQCRVRRAAQGQGQAHKKPWQTSLLQAQGVTNKAVHSPQQACCRQLGPITTTRAACRMFHVLLVA